MNAQMKSDETPKNCAACDREIITPFGKSHDFCSEDCKKAGRSYCKYDHKLLDQSSGTRTKKDFCKPLCRQRYYRRGALVNPNPLEEYARKTCRGCNEDITQGAVGPKRQFCKHSCYKRYVYYLERGLDITQRWGQFSPETRKSLLSVELHMGIGAAKQLAGAIEREYIVRKTEYPSSMRGRYITCTCIKCGKTFRRKSWGQNSREYCSYKCQPFSGQSQGKRETRASLNWEQVNEIRNLHAAGQLTQAALAMKFCVSQGNIHKIVHNERWKPENDPRRKETT